MNDLLSAAPVSAPVDARKRPGVVILVAILKFLWASLFLLFALFSVLALAFGAGWGLDDYVSRQVAQYSPRANMSYGVTAIFGICAAAFSVTALFFLSLGIGLLRGRKWAWYLQVAMNVAGLLSVPFTFLWNPLTLPMGAVLNIVILVFFFQPRTRGFFGT